MSHRFESISRGALSAPDSASRTVTVSVCLDECFRTGMVSCRSRDSLKPCNRERALDEQRSRISASSDALDACSFRRNKSESIAFAGWRDTTLKPSTSVGMMRVIGARPVLEIGDLDILSFSRPPAQTTLFERVSSSKTARGDMSPPWSLTRRLKEEFAPPIASDFGCPFCVRNRRSVSHPSTTRSHGELVVRLSSLLAVA